MWVQERRVNQVALFYYTKPNISKLFNFVDTNLRDLKIFWISRALNLTIMVYFTLRWYKVW